MLKHPTHGFTLVRTFTMVTHLYTTYGHITPEMLAANNLTMRTPWSTASPIKNLFSQLDLRAVYAITGKTANTDVQLVLFAYTNIAANNQMELVCRDWRKRPTAKKTWAKFKVD